MWLLKGNAFFRWAAAGYPKFCLLTAAVFMTIIVFRPMYAMEAPILTVTNTPTPDQAVGTQSSPVADPTLQNLIPLPVSVKPASGTFAITLGTSIYFQPDDPNVRGVSQFLVNKLAPATGFKLALQPTTEIPPNGNIYIALDSADSALGDEGYQLTVTSNLVTLVAYKPEGLFRGIQTIRQLLPPSIERSTLQTGPWVIPNGTIRDYPRFAWRGAMLDVARHFFNVQDVKRFLDQMAYYKFNRFHLHLSDDQGWRIAIKSWPNLTSYGGSTKVGGGPGGFYTQQDYADIVAYAQSLYITVVPEIDMPGHTNAALASYAELNCDGVAPGLYTGTKVGFSSFCAKKEITYTFLNDVIKEISALTPGPYFHIGGDESHSTSPEDYIQFIERTQTLVQANGKQIVGWEEISQAKLLPGTIVQHWNADLAKKGVAQGAKVIMSPASKAYMDIKYDTSTVLGLNWAGYINVETGYNWDPATQIDGVTEKDIAGVEAPLWTETIQTTDDIDYMVFPRLLGYAEIGWSPVAGRGWDEYKTRLAAHGSKLDALGIKFFHAPQIHWQ